METDVDDLIYRIKKKRDQAAADELVKLYYNEIFAYMYRQTRDEHLSYDLTQEIFIKILKSIKKFDKKKASFRTYLYRVSQNHLINYLNSKLHKTRIVEDEYNEEIMTYSENIEENLIIDEQSEAVKSLIVKLPLHQQQVIRLRFYSDLSLTDIAEIQEVSLSTVKSRLYQSLNKLKVLIETEGYYE